MSHLPSSASALDLTPRERMNGTTSATNAVRSYFRNIAASLLVTTT